MKGDQKAKGHALGKRLSRNSAQNVDVQVVEVAGTIEVTAGPVFLEPGMLVVTEGDTTYAVHPNDFERNFEEARPEKELQDFRAGKKSGKLK